MHGWRVRAILVGLAAASVATASHADRSIESVGVGVAIASPVVGPSLLLKLDERWSAGIVLGEDASGIGGQVQVNYAREGSRGGYWTVGGGRSTEVDLSIVRGGYGYAWQKGPFPWHVEATLNVPFNSAKKKDGLGGLPALRPRSFRSGSACTTCSASVDRQRPWRGRHRWSESFSSRSAIVLLNVMGDAPVPAPARNLLPVAG